MFLPLHDDNPTTRFPAATFALIGLNVLAFVWLGRLSSQQRQVLIYQRGFIPARIAQLKDPRLVVDVPIYTDAVVFHPFRGWVHVKQEKTLRLTADRREIYLSMLTCMFLHGSWMHLLGNMWFLWLFGNNVEDRLGSVTFLVLYLLGGMLGSCCHWARGPASFAPVIGASGAVATILGAYAVTWPWARVRTLVILVVFITLIELPAMVVLGGWFLLQLLEGTEAGVAQNVAWWAHIGGFVAGVVLMPLFGDAVGASRPQTRRREPPDDDW